MCLFYRICVDMTLCKICGSNETYDEYEICSHCKIIQRSMTKICSKCKEELPLSDFYRDKDKWDGYKTICINCYSKYYSIKS